MEHGAMEGQKKGQGRPGNSSFLPRSLGLLVSIWTTPTLCSHQSENRAVHISSREGTAFCFWQCFSYCLYLNILIIQAQGYTQPSQPLLIFTSSATVSGDPARVTSWTKGSKKPTIRTEKPILESSLFRESDCNWADVRGCPQSCISLHLSFNTRSNCLRESKLRKDGVFLGKMTLDLKTNYSSEFS